MMMAYQRVLTAAGLFSGVAALLHVACVLGGGEWYRFFGAGEDMAQAAERGSMTPGLTTAGIAAVLAIWSAYAFSGAGLIPRLPLIRTGLALIAWIYLLRGLLLFVVLASRPGLVDAFMVWSSLIVLGGGLAYAAGLMCGWAALSRPPLAAF